MKSKGKQFMICHPYNGLMALAISNANVYNKDFFKCIHLDFSTRKVFYKAIGREGGKEIEDFTKGWIFSLH